LTHSIDGVGYLFQVSPVARALYNNTRAKQIKVLKQEVTGIKIFWVFLASIAALFILFFMSTFPLRLYFALLFFLIILLLGYHLFNNKEKNEFYLHLTKVEAIKRFYPILPYLLGGIGSLIVVGTRSIGFRINNASVLVSFFSLPPLLLMKVVLGFFLLSAFPGYIVCKNFFKEGLSSFEGFGLILALSYCVNAIIGVIIWRAGLPLSSKVVITFIWFFVLVTEILGRLWRKGRTQISLTKSSLTIEEFLLLFLTSLTLLLASYSAVLFPGPMSVPTGGDVTRYMIWTNEFLNFDNARDRPWLFSYITVGHYVTGLPVMYVYNAMQYMVLLVPASIYLFMKKMFPQKRKAAAIAVLMITIMGGMASLPFLMYLLRFPLLLDEYLGGSIRLTMNTFFKIGVSNSGVYILQARTLEFGLYLYAISFLYGYLSEPGEEKRLRDLFLGALFLTAGAMTHSFFLLLCFIGTVVIYSLVNNLHKQRFIIMISVITLFLFIFEVISGFPIINRFIVFYVETVYFSSSLKGRMGSAYLIFFIISLCTYFFLLFRKEIGRILFKDKYTRFSYRVKEMSQALHINILNITYKYWFWSILFLFTIFLPAYICYLNIDNINIYMKYTSQIYIRPWYLWALYFGPALFVIIGTLPQILKYNRLAMKFVWSWVFSLLGLSLVFYLLHLIIPLSVWSKPAVVVERYLQGIIYPLSCLFALGMDYAFKQGTEGRLLVKIKIFKRLLNFSMDKKKAVIYTFSSFLILSLAFSFLSFVYVYESYYSDAKNKGPILSSSEAEALEWMYNHLPNNSTIIALSGDSYRKLCIILSNEVLPLFIDTEGASGSWPRNIIMKSQLPESVLYSLHQFKATHIFVSPKDEKLMSETSNGKTFISIMKTFALDQSFGDAKIYRIPRYPLYNDSNYHLVTGIFNFPKYFDLFEFEETQNPVVIADDKQSSFWTGVGIGPGTGDLEAPSLSDDTSEKEKGTDSLKLQVVKGGSYKGWSIDHEYAIYQDWSEKDFVSLYWFGNNTGKKIVLQLFTPDVNNRLGWIWLDNYTGWKRLLFHLDKADFEVNNVDLKNISLVRIGVNSIREWNSEAATFRLDRAFLDVKKLVTSVVMEQPNYLEVSEMLHDGRISYSILSDYELDTLVPNHVYIFPYNRRLPQGILNNLIPFVRDGAHVIFMDPFFASFNEIGQIYPQKLGIKNFTFIPLNTDSPISGIIFDEETVNSSLSPSQIIRFMNQSQLEIIASFKLFNDSTIPYIVQERVGKGSFTFVDMNMVSDMPYPLRRDVLTLTRRAVLKTLPTPITPKTELNLSIPSALFSAFQGSTIELWRNKDLLNNLIFHDDIFVSGNFTIVSDQIYLSLNKLYVKEMKIVTTDNVITIRNDTLFDLQVFGSGWLTSNESQAVIYNSPYGRYNLINITNNLNTFSEQSIELNDVRVVFKRNSEVGRKQTYSEANVSINAITPFFTVKIDQPSLIINGVVNGSLQGAFIHENHFFRGASVYRASFQGKFKLNILYSSGMIYAQIQDIKDIYEMNLEPLE